MYCNLTAYGCYLSTFLTISKLIFSTIQPLLRCSFTMVNFFYLFNNIKRGNYIIKIMFLNKIDIFKNKPNWKKQKFVTVVTKLWHCDEIRRFDGTILFYDVLYIYNLFSQHISRICVQECTKYPSCHLVTTLYFENS